MRKKSGARCGAPASRERGAGPACPCAVTGVRGPHGGRLSGARAPRDGSGAEKVKQHAIASAKQNRYGTILMHRSNCPIAYHGRSRYHDRRVGSPNDFRRPRSGDTEVGQHNAEGHVGAALLLEEAELPAGACGARAQGRLHATMRLGRGQQRAEGGGIQSARAAGAHRSQRLDNASTVGPTRRIIAAPALN